MLPYSDAKKIYGPYKAKDNRLRVVVRYCDSSMRTVSYPKYLVEIHLGRYLYADETVDHIDRDPLNNDLSNLRVLYSAEHHQQDVLRNAVQSLVCSICGTPFTPTKYQIGERHRKARAKSGPYCSRRCAGIDSRNPRRVVQPIVVDKVTLKSLASEKLQGMMPKSVNPEMSGNTERSSLGSENV